MIKTRLAAIAASGTTHVLFAFFVMGGWAFLANIGHPWPKPLYAALVQGAISASITLCMKSALDRLSRHLEGQARLFVPPLIVCSASLILLLTLHTVFATPELLRTIALPFAIAATYAILYNWSLWRGG